jgi:caa(3)-type oxidase subunit IV
MSESTTHLASHSDHDHEHEAAHVAAHIKTYLGVGLILLVGTIITVLLSYVDFGSETMNIVVAMIVASIKVGFVAMVFMHLKSEKGEIYRVIFLCIFMCLVLFAFTALAVFDPITL